MRSKRRKLTVVEQQKANYNTMLAAIGRGRVALLECWDKRLQERVAVVVAINDEPNSVKSFVPLAAFINGNPYEVLMPPHPEVDGAFTTSKGEVFKPPNGRT